MNSLELIESFSEFKDDKLINRETLMAILEEVFRNTSKNIFRKEILHKLTAYFYTHYYSIFELSYKVSDEFAPQAVLRDFA